MDETDLGLSYTRSYLVLNKCDDADFDVRHELFREMCEIDLPTFTISAQSGEGVEALREAIFRELDVVRVYTKLPSAKDPDMDRPFTVRRGCNLVDLAGQVHKDYVENLKHARVWGTAVHDGTQVKGDYILHDRDIVELHM